ncbi:TPA: phosphate acetyltransferase [Candidatus Woesearchaeota archaeon]|nr:phosphate acetyltransferase [Candidatus Woesearchaeota archaeon]
MVDIVNLIKERARKHLKKVLLVEGEDDRIIEAASKAVAEKLAKPILLGDERIIKNIAKDKQISLVGIEILDYKKLDDLNSRYAKQLHELRKAKGMELEEAQHLIQNPNYFGTLYVRLGKADAVVGGCKFTTAEFMKPAFQVIGKRKDVVCASGVSAIVMADSVIFLSDTDFSIKPSVEELAQIAMNAAECAQSLGFIPKVALLSHSTKGSGEHPSLLPIREALAIVKKKRPELIIDGEMQADAAISPNSARRKCPGSVIQGDANVLIFPDIFSANISCHLLHQLAKIEIFGSFAWGMDKPVTNGGRGYNADEILNVIATAAFQANL